MTAVTCQCGAEGPIPSGVTVFEAADALRAAGWRCSSGTWRCHDCYVRWQKAVTDRQVKQVRMWKKEKDAAPTV